MLNLMIFVNLLSQLKKNLYIYAYNNIKNLLLY